jgi:hypothetical protein
MAKEDRKTQDLDDKDPVKMDDKELLELLKQKVDAWFAYFKDNIIDGRERKRFAFGDQWEDQVAQEYKNTGKVMLTTNKLNPYIRRLVGEVRAFTPALKVKRTDELIPNDKIPKILENNLRKISLDSDAKTAYQTAFRDEIVVGYGALAAGLEFKSNNSFQQKVTSEEMQHPERVGFDPAAKTLTKWDGDYSFSYESLSKDEFKNTYGFVPETEQAMVSTFSRDDGQSFTIDWINEDRIIVFDFYLKEYFDRNIVLLANGQTLDRKEYNELVDTINKLEEENPGAINPSVMEEMKIVQKRKVKDFKIINYKFIGDDILERKEWPSKFLRHVFVDGDSYYLEGRQHTQPFIKDAIDPQRMLNFINTEIVQNIKDANKEDYLGTPDNIKGLEKIWKDKKRRKGLLLANPDKKTSQLPIKQAPAQINPQLHPLSVKLENDIRSCLGIFQSNQGATEGDLSGVAELTRITQGNLSTFVYVSNLTKAIEQLGRIQLDLIKNTTQSTQPLDGIDESGEESAPIINQPQPFGGVSNDLSQGEFDVAISASAAFTIQKMQEYREILSYVAAFPQMQQVIPDIAARKLATDEGIDIANRAKGTLPLPVQAQDKDNPQAAQAAQRQMQQQSQIQQMMQQMQVQAEQIKMLAEKQKGQAAQTTSTANMMNAQTNRMTEAGKAQIEAAKLQTEQQKAAMDLEKERIKATTQLVR